MRAGVAFCFMAMPWLAGLACKPDAEKERPPPAKTTETKKESAPTPVTRYPAARRVVAIGDVHGDLAATRAVLRLAGLMDEKERWSGGDAVLVQTGDVLDRGDGEQAILDLLSKLQTEAASANGKVVLLNGNHELMNVAGDFRYVTPGGFLDFTDVPDLALGDPGLANIPDAQRARAAVFRPGGIYARKLAHNPVAVVIGETAFAHGGILPSYARELERYNAEVATWLMGIDPGGMQIVQATDSPVWSRHFSDEPDLEDCKMLGESLSVLSAKRMVVGHTVQPTVRPACDEHVWRIDVGMAAHYGGKPEALEITADGVAVLR